MPEVVRAGSDSFPYKPAPQQPAGRPAYAALPALWAIVVLVLTLTPANEMPNTPSWELLSFDTAAHAGVFGISLAGVSVSTSTTMAHNVGRAA